MQVDEDVHVVLGDSVLSDLLHSQLLATSVVVVTSDGRHVGPVTDGDTQCVDTVGGKFVNVLSRDVCLVAVLQQSATLGLTQDLAEAVFIDGVGRIVVEEAGLNVLLKNQPATEVHTIGFVVSPSREGVGSGTNPLGTGPVDQNLQSKGRLQWALYRQASRTVKSIASSLTRLCTVHQ